MKIALACILFAFSASAQAFSGSLSVKASENANQDKVRQEIGLTMSQPLFFGLGWWSWSGIGQTIENQSEISKWAQTAQGIDWSFGRFKIGGTAKFQLENDFKDSSTEFGARLSVKLW